MKEKIQITENLKKPSARAFYGTAGYRSNTSDLINIITRASYIAYLRSCSFAGKRIGLMITASHNPVDYNGVKFIDYNGNMLDKMWERCSDELVNCEDEDFCKTLKKILSKTSNLSDIYEGIVGRVVIGRDTRESGISITENIKAALGQTNCIIEDYGIVSTPQMHYLIRHSNLKSELLPKEVYIEHLISRYNALRSLTNIDTLVMADTANGVISAYLSKNFDISTVNDDNGILNHKCGADYVKTHCRKPDVKFDFNSADKSVVYASFDGDADRLVLFKIDEEFTLIDGDVQAYLLANYFRYLLKDMKSNLKIGVILSFYSNGGVVEALNNFNTEMVQTGVKNFVKAAKNYDIGIYFEPNGHGSVIFSEKAISLFLSGSSTQHKILYALSQLFDPCIGDALANLIAFKCLFNSDNLCKEYQENGSRLLAVRIRKKSVLVVNDKNIVMKPVDLQARIDEEASKCNGRAFIRLSGTEDVVRVYAEAYNVNDADMLCLVVAQLVYDMCDGVGRHPEIDYFE